jgi:tetratricopeptide (TPR) repeat protein
VDRDEQWHCRLNLRRERGADYVARIQAVEFGGESQNSSPPSERIPTNLPIIPAWHHKQNDRWGVLVVIGIQGEQVVDTVGCRRRGIAFCVLPIFMATVALAARVGVAQTSATFHESDASDWRSWTADESGTEPSFLAVDELDWRLMRPKSEQPPDYLPPEYRASMCLPPSDATAKYRRASEEHDKSFTPPPSRSPRYAIAQERQFADANVALATPGSPWVEEFNPTTDANVRLTMSRRGPDLGLLLVAERVGVELKYDNKTLLQYTQVLARRMCPAVEFTDASPASAHGLPGLVFEAEAPASHCKVHYAYWVGARNGFAYQLIVFGETANAAEVRAELLRLVPGLRQIDPNRTSHADGAKFAHKFQSAAFGYEVDLSDLGWIQSAAVEEGTAANEFAAVRGPVAVRVLPCPLPGHRPDTETLARAMVMHLDLSYPSGCTDRKPILLGKLSGERFSADRVVQGTMLKYRIRVLADDRCAYLLAGVATNAVEDMADIETALDRVRIVSRDLPDDPPLTERQGAQCGAMLNEFGITAYRRGDTPAAIDYFACSLKCDPSNETSLTNYVEVLIESNRIGDALALVESRLATSPEDPHLSATRARLLAEQGKVSEASQAYADVFARGYADELALKQFLDLVVKTKNYDEGIAAAAAVAKSNPTARVESWLAAMYSLNGDDDKAIAMMQDLRKRQPDDLGIAIDLASVYEHAKKYAEALELTQQLLDAGADNEEVLLAHGSILLHLERYSDAKRTFERVLELYPHSETARDLLTFSSNQLGEGENSLLKTPIEPVEFLPEVEAAIDKAPRQPKEVVELYGAEELARVKAIEFRRDKPLRTTTLRRIKVHTSGGVSRYSTLTFDLDPIAERLYVNRLVVRDGGGQTVAEGSVENYFVVDDTTSGMQTHSKTVKVPVPGLKPGYTIDCLTTREARVANEKFRFQKLDLSSSVPADVSACFVRGDIEGLACKTSIPMEVGRLPDAIYCVQLNAPPFQDEARQPPHEKYMPIVWFGDAKADWAVLARDYLQGIDDQLELDGETRHLARELTKSCHTDRERLATLAAFVQSSCTFKAIEFGCRGHVPNTAARTLELKYGDCKDHAVLLHELLAGVGIPSDLAVVNSSADIVQDLPSFEQFDHMILYVPGQAIGQSQNAIGGLLVDVSEKDANPLAFPPYRMANKSALVLDPDNPRLVHLPALALDAGQITSQRRVTIREQSGRGNLVEADVDEQLTLNDYLAPGMRGYLRLFEPGARREAIQDVLSRYAPTRVNRFDVENLDDTAKPLVLRLEYVVPDALHRVTLPAGGTTLIGQLPCQWETHYLEADYDDERLTPFEVNTPRLVQTSLEVVLPAGYQLADLSRWTNSGQSEFAAWASQARQSGSIIRLDHRVRVPAGRHPATEYQPYYAAMKESLSLLQTPVTLQERTISTANHSGRNKVLR